MRAVDGREDLFFVGRPRPSGSILAVVLSSLLSSFLGARAGWRASEQRVSERGVHETSFRELLSSSLSLARHGSDTLHSSSSTRSHTHRRHALRQLPHGAAQLGVLARQRLERRRRAAVAREREQEAFVGGAVCARRWDSAVEEVGSDRLGRAEGRVRDRAVTEPAQEAKSQRRTHLSRRGRACRSAEREGRTQTA